jgi:hypothetical protein
MERVGTIGFDLVLESGAGVKSFQEIISVFLFFLGLTIGMAAHEAGHLLCAVIASIPVRLVSVGVGPVLLRRRRGETTLQLRLLPLAGFVMTYPTINVDRRWSLLLLLGGFFGNVTVIALVAWLVTLEVAPSAILDNIGPIVFAQLYLIAVNVIPFRSRIDGREVWSDGWQLLRLLRRRRAHEPDAYAVYAALIGPYCNGGVPAPLASAASSRVLYHLCRPERWIDEEAHDDSRDALLRELARGRLRLEEKLMVLDSIITDGLILGSLGSLAQLDEWSSHAVQLAPQIKPLLISRGCVLVLLGRSEEGKAILEAVGAETVSAVALKAATVLPLDLLLMQTFLARAEFALGARAAAVGWAAAARKTLEAAPALPILPALTAMVDRLATEPGR